MALALRIRVSLFALAALLAVPDAAIAQITGGPGLTLPGRIYRNNLAYDSVNQVYLAIVDRPPVRGQFLNKNGVPIGSSFLITPEPGYIGWASIAFGGPPNDPVFVVTYIIADGPNPKFARFVRYAGGGTATVSGPMWITDVTTEWSYGEKAQSFWNGLYFVVGSRVMPAGWSQPTPQINLLHLSGWVSGGLVLGDNQDFYGSPSVTCAANDVCVAVGFKAGIPTGYSGGTYARRFNGMSLTPLGDLVTLASNAPNEDHVVVYQTHTGRFLAQWFRGPTPGYIDTRLIGTDGSLSALDLSRGIGPNAGTNAMAFNSETRTSLLVTKQVGDALVVLELGDDGYPININNRVVITNWDGQVSDYLPSIAANNADKQWFVSANLAGGMVGKMITGGGSSDLIRNGTFGTGMTNWAVFAQPTVTDLVTSISNGVLQFYRQPGSAQGVVLQAMGVGMPAGSPMSAMFELGNSSSVRKRITVLLHDSDFSDLQMCTFWLAPGAPLRSYRINTHSNYVWDNATLSFYAATTGSDGGAYLLDNVHVYSMPGQPVDRTECVDPTTPGPQPYADSNSILVNGNFQGGLAPWGVFGQITHQITGGVFQFVRPSGTPAGVILQATGIGGPMHARMTATMSLGNSSNVRKRVTVIIHDNDFSDLSACTFWLEPGQNLSTYTMKMYTSKAWTNATFSVYPSNVDIAQWIRFDNASLRVTMSMSLTGTECIEPGGSENIPGLTSIEGGWTAGSTLSSASAGTSEPAWTAQAGDTGVQLLMLASPIDLRDATSASLRFDSLLSDGASDAFVEVTRDGVTWVKVARVPPSDEWTSMAVDLTDYLGDIAYVRFVYAGVAGAGSVDMWSIRGVSIDAGSARVFRRPYR